MLMWIIILALLLIGISLIIVELVFIPGTTVVGLLGLIFTITGIVVSYNHFGREIGMYVLLGASIIMAVSLYFSFRSNAWSRFSLKSSIDSKVNEGSLASISIGDEGVTISALRPVGKANFHDHILEVKTSGNYMEQGQRVKIILIQANQIFVEPLI